jgi:FAD/FMN-containing dehydrogenase
MTQMLRGAVGELRTEMDGLVLAPSDPGLEDGRRVWNAGIDRHPSVIARCASPADVAAAIGFARGSGLELSVRGGAHNSAGTPACSGPSAAAAATSES